METIEMVEQKETWVDTLLKNRYVRLFALLAPFVSVPLAIITAFVLTGRQRYIGAALTIAASVFGLGILILYFYWPERRRQLESSKNTQIADQLRLALSPTEGRLEEIQRQLTASDIQRAYDALAVRYKWGYDRIDVQETIYANGGAEIKRTVTVQPRALLDKIPQSLNVHLTPEQSLQPLPPERVSVVSLTPGYTAEKIEKVIRLPQGWVVEVKFAPSVPAGTTVTFLMTERLDPETYVLGKPEAWYRERGYNDDFFAWRIDRPTRYFRAEVSFPKHYVPLNYGARVIYQPMPVEFPDAQRLAEEETRLGEHLGLVKQSEDKFRLTIGRDSAGLDLPLLGLIYGVRWDPFWSS
jgi:hypothetical protein